MKSFIHMRVGNLMLHAFVSNLHLKGEKKIRLQISTASNVLSRWGRWQADYDKNQ